MEKKRLKSWRSDPADPPVESSRRARGNCNCSRSLQYLAKSWRQPRCTAGLGFSGRCSGTHRLWRGPRQSGMLTLSCHEKARCPSSHASECDSRIPPGRTRILGQPLESSRFSFRRIRWNHLPPPTLVGPITLRSSWTAMGDGRVDVSCRVWKVIVREQRRSGGSWSFAGVTAYTS